MKKMILVIILIVTMLVGTLPVAAMSAMATPISAFSYRDISGHWAEKAIVKYADPKLFSDASGNFAPNKAISRTEFVLMLHKALGVQINYFAAKYKNDVMEAVLLQLVFGRGSNRLDPKAGATRAEAMVLTDRLVNTIANLSSGIDIKPQAIIQNSSLTMKLSIKNNSAVPVTIDYSSGQRFDLQLLDAKKEILYTWSADKSFILMLSSETLNPGQALDFTETLDAAVFESLRASAAYMRVYVTGTSQDFNIDPNGYTIPLK